MLQNKSAPTTSQISHFKGYKTQLEVGCNNASRVASLSSETSPPPPKPPSTNLWPSASSRYWKNATNALGATGGCDFQKDQDQVTSFDWRGRGGHLLNSVFHVTEVDAILMFFFSTCFFFENMSVKCGGVFFGPVENQKADCRVHCHQPSFSGLPWKCKS